MVNVAWEGPQGIFTLNMRPLISQWHALSWDLVLDPYCFSTVIFHMADPFLFQPSLPPPLSEIEFGCSPIYYITLSLYFIFTLSSSFVKNATTLVVICMVTGLLASALMCNVVRTFADVWEIENCGVPMAIFFSTILYSPSQKVTKHHVIHGTQSMVLLLANGRSEVKDTTRSSENLRHERRGM